MSLSIVFLLSYCSMDNIPTVQLLYNTCNSQIMILCEIMSLHERKAIYSQNGQTSILWEKLALHSSVSFTGNKKLYFKMHHPYSLLWKKQHSKLTDWCIFEPRKDHVTTSLLPSQNNHPGIRPVNEKLLIQSLTASFQTNCPAVNEQVHGAMAEEVPEGQSSSGLSSRASFV